MLSFPSANLQTLLLSNTSLCLPEILHNQPMHLCPLVAPSACPRQLDFPEAHHPVRPCSPCNPLAEAAHPATSQAGRACVLLSALCALHHSSSTHLQTHLPADTDATGLDHLSFLSCSLPSLTEDFSNPFHSSSPPTPVILRHAGDLKHAHTGNPFNLPSPQFLYQSHLSTIFLSRTLELFHSAPATAHTSLLPATAPALKYCNHSSQALAPTSYPLGLLLPSLDTSVLPPVHRPLHILSP